MEPVKEISTSPLQAEVEGGRKNTDSVGDDREVASHEGTDRTIISRDDECELANAFSTFVELEDDDAKVTTHEGIDSALRVVADVFKESNNNTPEDERDLPKTLLPSLIPSLPMEIAEICLARVPWDCVSPLKLVCKSWNAFVTSGDIFAVPSQQCLSDSVLVLVSLPTCSLGNLTLSFYDAKTPKKLKLHKPLLLLDKTSLFNNRRGFKCAIIGTDLFIIGGFYIFHFTELNGDKYIPTTESVWRLNIVTKKWTKVADMHSSRRDFACSVINDKVYVAGGVSSWGYDRNILNLVEMYDYKHDTWEVLPNLEKGRVGCFGVTLNDHFLVIGGESYFDGHAPGFENESTSFLQSTEILNIHTCQWETVENMWQGHGKLPRAVAVFDHSLFALDKESLKIYDDVTNRWNNIMSTKIPNTYNMMKYWDRQQERGDYSSGDQLVVLPGQGSMLRVGPWTYISTSGREHQNQKLLTTLAKKAGGIIRCVRREQHQLLRLQKSGTELGSWSGNVVGSDVDRKTQYIPQTQNLKIYKIVASGIVNL